MLFGLCPQKNIYSGGAGERRQALSVRKNEGYLNSFSHAQLQNKFKIEYNLTPD